MKDQSTMGQPFTVNGRDYQPSNEPVVVICVDGSEPAYHEQAIAAGRMPWLAKGLKDGFSNWPAHCAMPALTNPNNMSIATGRPARDHGISGNYMLDPDTGLEVLMNDKTFLRIPTIFAAAAASNNNVVVVTAKDKLRQLLGAGLVESGPGLADPTRFVEPDRRGVCFSAEKADQATLEDNGIGDVLNYVGRPLPDVYSADLSEFVMAAGVKLLTDRRPELMFLSLTDYIQHKHAPGTEVANDFYAMLDNYAEQLDALGAVVVITADHGMSAKTDAAGTPQVIYLEEDVNELLGDGKAQVILPITDPYTVHHGALGSFASVYVQDGVDLESLGSSLAQIAGVQTVLDRAEAADRHALPSDRIGDLIVLAEEGFALGRYRAWHNLDQLDVPLRSHGALGEINIPFIVNRPLTRPDDLEQDYAEAACVYNYDAFWIATTALADSEN